MFIFCNSLVFDAKKDSWNLRKSNRKIQIHDSLGENMKKAILILAVFGAICALGFSERFWHFESGARDLDGKVFGRISVINKTGAEIDVSGEPLENNGKGLYFEDSILISCRARNCDDYDAIFSIDSKHLQIVICPRGTYEIDSHTHILPPMRISHNPPPPKHQRRHDPAPKKMKPHHTPMHHEPNGKNRKSAPNKNDARPQKPDSPQKNPHQGNSRPPRPENPRRPIREKR